MWQFSMVASSRSDEEGGKEKEEKKERNTIRDVDERRRKSVTLNDSKIPVNVCIQYYGIRDKY